MTYNIGGGRRSYVDGDEDFDENLASVIDVIQQTSPDILVVQESTAYQDADGRWHSVTAKIARDCGFGENFQFGPTLSLQEHMHTRKTAMIDAIFDSHQDWKVGNAVFSRKGFVRLGDTLKPGGAANVPLFKPPIYEGNRDTDPRFALLARVDCSPLFPFVVGVHLTTLLGERGMDRVIGKVDEAKARRTEEAARILDLIRKHVLRRGELAFLLGDFNASVSESSISQVLVGAGGFVPLKPSRGPSATHPKVSDAIDHIFLFPKRRLVSYECWTIESGASDHLPVVADVIIK